MKYLIFITLISLLYGCNNSAPQDIVSFVKESKTDKQSVKKYLNNDTFLDVNVQSLLNPQKGSSSRTSSSEEDALCKMKAAIHRFYSHVKIQEGKYSCSLVNAQQINISSELFSILQQNLEAGNAWIEKCKQEGKDVIITEINEEYLNSLLE